MSKPLKIVALHPREWARGGYDEQCGAQVQHVSIGGDKPKRLTGDVSFDGIGEVATSIGIHEFLKCVAEFKPDIILFGIHFNLDRKVFENIRERNNRVKFVMHYTDQRSTVSKAIKPYLDLIDMLLVTNQDKTDHQKYFEAGIPVVRTLYDGVSPTEYWPVPIEPVHDCFFGGNNFLRLGQQMKDSGQNPEWIMKFEGALFRDELLEEVNQRFDLVIRGEWGWDKDRFQTKPVVFHPYYNRAMREAKIILSTFNVFRYRLFTRRLFRSIMTGRMYMSQYCPGFEHLFQNHKHLVWYHTIEEAIDLIYYYLKNEQEREEIANRGREELLSKHTFRHRLIEFVKICREVF